MTAVIDGKKQAFFCDFCRGSEPLNLPCEISELALRADAFAANHAHAEDLALLEHWRGKQNDALTQVEADSAMAAGLASFLVESFAIRASVTVRELAGARGEAAALRRERDLNRAEVKRLGDLLQEWQRHRARIAALEDVSPEKIAACGKCHGSRFECTSCGLPREREQGGLVEHCSRCWGNGVAPLAAEEWERCETCTGLGRVEVTT